MPSSMRYRNAQIRVCATPDGTHFGLIDFLIVLHVQLGLEALQEAARARALPCQLHIT